jgi:hypothetical protein
VVTSPDDLAPPAPPPLLRGVLAAFRAMARYSRFEASSICSYQLVLERIE